tara:strand:+ start:1281 stop:1571 length:291 start_codon:yes stop_codon:yes gene_type:complete
MLVEIDRKLAKNSLSAELAREIAEEMSLDLAALRTSGEISNDAFLEAGVIQGGIAVLANMIHSGVNQHEIMTHFQQIQQRATRICLNYPELSESLQ